MICQGQVSIFQSKDREERLTCRQDSVIRAPSAAKCDKTGRVQNMMKMTADPCIKYICGSDERCENYMSFMHGFNNKLKGYRVLSRCRRSRDPCSGGGVLVNGESLPVMEME
jgi:hypothetical protein